MPSTGERIGPYELLRLLGGGAFGEVWLVRHLDLRVERAMKIPTDPDYVKQLRLEGQIQFDLEHPNIVETLELDSWHTPPYFVMEYVEGQDLRKVLNARGKLPVPEALGILTQILDALSAAHAKGILHRDLKPENILLTPDGRVKVADFGLGKVQAQVAQSLILSGSMVSSEGKSVSGTFEYMSPEQRRGDPADPRDDLYAVGIVGCELLTGSRPLPGVSAEEHFEEAGVAKGYSVIFRGALALASRRYPCADAMRTDTLNALAAEQARIEAERRRVEEGARRRRENAQRDHERRRAADGLRAVQKQQGAEMLVRRRRQEEAARACGVPVEKDFELRNGVSMRMVFIPAGEFDMGSPEEEAGRGADERLHRVAIGEAVWMGKYLVTREQWHAFMDEDPNPYKAAPREVDYFAWYDANCPVDERTWDECLEFLRRLNAVAGGEHYSLPTEAQWEYACRAGSTTRFCFGDSDSQLDEYAWYSDNSRYRLHPVGGKKPNAWGLHDMHGSLHERTASLYNANYDGSEGRYFDPGVGGRMVMVLRGGCWHDGPSRCRSASRFGLLPMPGGEDWGSGGLRVVRRLLE